MVATQIGDEMKVSFEDALDKTGFGLYNYIHTSLTGLVIISFACVAYGITIIVPSSACELNTSGAQQGALAAAPLIGTILGAMLWGYLGDTRGRRNMLIASLLSSALVNSVASLSVNWIMLMILQFIASMLASGKYTLSMTMLSESVPLAKRNFVLLLVTSIFLLSQGVMAVLAIPIIPLSFSYYLPSLGIYWNSWRTLLIVYSLPSIISAVWLIFMQESPKFVFMKGDEERTIEILKNIHRINKGSGEELQVKGLLVESFKKNEEKSPSSVKSQIAPLFKAPLLKYTIIMTTLSIFLQIGAFLIWLPSIANKFVQVMRMGESSDLTLCSILHFETDILPDPDATPCALNVSALLMVLTVCVVQSLVNVVISLVVDRTGRRNTVMAVTAVVGTCGILVNLVPNAIGSAVLFTIFLMGILVLGLYTTISVALFPTHLRAMAVSLTMTGGRTAGFASIQIVNYLLANNCELGFYIFACIYTSSAVVVSFLPDDRLLQKSTQNDTTEDENVVSSL